MDFVVQQRFTGPQPDLFGTASLSASLKLLSSPLTGLACCGFSIDKCLKIMNKGIR